MEGIVIPLRYYNNLTKTGKANFISLAKLWLLLAYSLQHGIRVCKYEYIIGMNVAMNYYGPLLENASTFEFSNIFSISLKVSLSSCLEEYRLASR